MEVDMNQQTWRIAEGEEKVMLKRVLRDESLSDVMLRESIAWFANDVPGDEVDNIYKTYIEFILEEIAEEDPNYYWEPGSSTIYYECDENEEPPEIDLDAVFERVNSRLEEKF